MADSVEHQETSYSEQDFWQKLRQFAVLAGRNVVEKALTLYYAAQRPETPMWAKMVIYSSLAYFILPTDALPDFMPFVGYTDDLGTIASALVTVAMAITPDVKTSARQQVKEWFGDEAAEHEHPQAGDSIREITIE